MKVCENCLKEHDGSYASGRFCNKKCSCSFSTKNNKEEIKLKIKESLKNSEKYKAALIKRYYSDSSKPTKTEKKFKILKNNFLNKEISFKECVCQECNTIFTVEKNKNPRMYCSRICLNNGTRENLSNKRIEHIKLNGSNDKSIKCEYNFKDNLIKCDSKLEYACLNYLEINFKPISIERCNFTLEYLDENTKRKFLPDFIIKTENNTLIVECKSYASTKNLNDKWRKYNELSILKKIVLKQYCKDNDFKCVWFTKDMHRKFYDNLKFNGGLAQ